MAVPRGDSTPRRGLVTHDRALRAKLLPTLDRAEREQRRLRNSAVDREDETGVPPVESQRSS